MAGRATQVLTNDDNANVLNGFPVSPGVIVGEASLVMDAQQFGTPAHNLPLLVV